MVLFEFKSPFIFVVIIIFVTFKCNSYATNSNY